MVFLAALALGIALLWIGKGEEPPDGTARIESETSSTATALEATGDDPSGRPHERELLETGEPAPTDDDEAELPRIVLRGTLVALDEFGNRFAREDGKLTLTTFHGGARRNTTQREVTARVEQGAWSVEMEVPVSVVANTATLGGRALRCERPQRILPRPWTDESSVDFEGTWFPTTLVHVYGRDTETELPSVDVAVGVTGFGRVHPGSFHVLVGGKPSPVTFESMERAEFWVRAPGYAWRRLSKAELGAVPVRVELEPAGKLRLDITGTLPRNTVLYLTHASGKALFLEVPQNIENLRVGKYTVEIQGHGSPTVPALASAAAEVVAGETRVVALEVRGDGR